MTRMFRALALLTAAAFALMAPAAFAQPAPFGQYAPAEEFPETITTSIYLPMRDGVRLAVSITRPARGGQAVEGRFPVLWHHTLEIAGPGSAGGPIGAGAQAKGYRGALNLARYGYVVVQVARRGQGPSFGRRRGYNDRTEAYDAYEVIDWLAAQPWSTGKVGVYGCSNTGDASMHAVTAANPHLAAAWAGCFSWEKYDGFLRGGIFANWGTGPERTIEQDMKVTGVQGDESKTLLRQAAEEHQGATVLAAMWASMPYRDSWSTGTASRFWYEGSVASFMPQMQASGTAIYVQGGWYDDLREQGLITFQNMTHDRHIVIGPWTHCGNGDFDLIGEMHRFFDQHLKGIDTGLNAQDPIHYFTVNAAPGTEWRSSKTWPVAGMEPTRFFLAGRTPTGGDLTAQAPRGKGSQSAFAVRYDVDCPSYKSPVPGLLTGAPNCVAEHAGPHFLGPVLKADTEVTGDPVADLWITSTATDGNLFVYLEDVAPDGTSTPVTEGRLKASLRQLNTPRYNVMGLPWHRAAAEDAKPLVPGEPAHLVFSILPTSWLFKAGHRMRVTVAGADYRERVRTPVTPAPVVTILGTVEHASTVVLPVVRALKTS